MEQRTNSGLIRQQKKNRSAKLEKENLAPKLLVYEHLHRSANFICVGTSEQWVEDCSIFYRKTKEY